MIKLFVNSAFFPQLKNILQNAESEICIVIYNWHFYQHDLSCNVSQLNQIIFDKLKRGVKVKVVVGNIKLFNQLKEKGINVKYKKMRGLVHSKLIVIDNMIATVGSHNFSENAFSRNEEASILTDDKDFVNQCKKYFDILFTSL